MGTDDLVHGDGHCTGTSAVTEIRSSDTILRGPAPPIATSQAASAPRSSAASTCSSGLDRRSSPMRARHSRTSGDGGPAKNPRASEPRELQRRGRAQELQRRDQPLLGRGEIGAEGKRRDAAPARARAPAPARCARGCCRGMPAGSSNAALDLAGILGAPQQIVLEAGIGDRQHGGDHVAVGLAAQVGNAVFGHHDVAQVARDGGVAVAPADVRGRPPASPRGWRAA